MLLAGCKTLQSTKIESGKFSYDYESDYFDELVLSQDGSFKLSFHYGFISACEGHWKYITKDTILLECGQEPPQNIIQRGYISERSRKIKVLNENRLKMPVFNDTKRKSVILKRNNNN